MAIQIPLYLINQTGPEWDKFIQQVRKVGFDVKQAGSVAGDVLDNVFKRKLAESRQLTEKLTDSIVGKSGGEGLVGAVKTLNALNITPYGYERMAFRLSGLVSALGPGGLAALGGLAVGVGSAASAMHTFNTMLERHDAQAIATNRAWKSLTETFTFFDVEFGKSKFFQGGMKETEGFLDRIRGSLLQIQQVTKALLAGNQSAAMFNAFNRKDPAELQKFRVDELKRPIEFKQAVELKVEEIKHAKTLQEFGEKRKKIEKEIADEAKKGAFSDAQKVEYHSRLVALAEKERELIRKQADEVKQLAHEMEQTVKHRADQFTKGGGLDELMGEVTQQDMDYELANILGQPGARPRVRGGRQARPRAGGVSGAGGQVGAGGGRRALVGTRLKQQQARAAQANAAAIQHRAQMEGHKFNVMNQPVPWESDEDIDKRIEKEVIDEYTTDSAGVKKASDLGIWAGRASDERRAKAKAARNAKANAVRAANEKAKQQRIDDAKNMEVEQQGLDQEAEFQARELERERERVQKQNQAAERRNVVKDAAVHKRKGLTDLQKRNRLFRALESGQIQLGDERNRRQDYTHEQQVQAQFDAARRRLEKRGGLSPETRQAQSDAIEAKRKQMLEEARLQDEEEGFNRGRGAPIRKGPRASPRNRAQQEAERSRRRGESAPDQGLNLLPEEVSKLAQGAAEQAQSQGKVNESVAGVLKNAFNSISAEFAQNKTIMKRLAMLYEQYQKEAANRNRAAGMGLNN